MIKWIDKLLKRVETTSKKDILPRLTVPEANPLSPCVIEPYNRKDDGSVEENKAYIPVSLLKEAINDDKMLNIAVAGNYGVGKSSVIKTAENELKGKHSFINISLASLLVAENKAIISDENTQRGPEPDEKVEDDDNKTVDLENGSGIVAKKASGRISDVVTDRQIEYSILQQILYHDRPQVTPKSRLKRIHKTRCLKPLIIAFLLMITGLALALSIGSKEMIERYLTLDSLSISLKVIRWGAILVLCIVLIFVCYYVGNSFNLSITKIAGKNVELKIKESLSIFNAYLDEIVYFFQSTKYDVVVFEDLDRFKEKEIIFYKLRELNTILNNSNYLKRKINFVYAVLDNLFDSTERVKFFDYIITVIPVVNSLNSYDVLKAHIKPTNRIEKLGKHELLNLCDYFQDMRLLLNIVNEFNQFAPLLDPEEMSEKVLFGLIVYKNYVPSDFAQMYNRSGAVASAMENVDKYANDIISRKKSENKTLGGEIKARKEELERQKVKLRLDAIDKARSLIGYAQFAATIRIDGKAYLADIVAKDAGLFEKFRNGDALLIINGSRFNVPSFSSIENNMVLPASFDAVMDSYEKEYEKQIREIDKKIKANNDDLNLYKIAVSNVYREDKTLLEKELVRLKDKDKINLVRFLILNGYIDRHYQYYISYFYPNALKREDRAFVMHAGCQDKLQFESNLVDIGEILKRFSLEDYALNSSLLNVNLIREVFKNPGYTSYRQPLLQLIKKDKQLGFLIICYQSSPSVPDRFYSMLHQEYDYWDEIDAMVNEDQDVLREIYLKYCDVRDGRVNEAFKAWLTDNYQFIDKHFDSIPSKRVKEDLFRNCSPVFSVLKFHNTPDVVLTDIINNQRYKFNRSNFSTIIKRLGFFDAYSTASYTSLLNDAYVALRKTVESNWNLALKNVFPDTSINEDSSTILAILNNSSVHLGDARSYLIKQRNRVNNARDIHDHALSYAFKNNLVKPGWDNVYYYSIEKGKGLPYDFLNNNHFNDKVINTLSKEQEYSLRELLLLSNRVDDPKFEELIPFFNVPFSEVPADMKVTRVRFLVEKAYIAFNGAAFRTVKDDYKLSSLFLNKNISTYMSNPGEYRLDNSDIVIAIKSIETKKSKCDFIRAIKNNAFEPSDELARIVTPFLQSGDIKVVDINFTLLLRILSRASKDVKKTLGKNAIIKLPYSKEKVTRLLYYIGGELKRLTSDSKQSSLTYSKDTIQILNYLVANGYIQSIEKKNGKIVVVK